MRIHRVGRTIVTGLVALTSSFLLLALPANAHNVLESADPGIGSSITSGPPYVSVTFNAPVQNGFTELIVLGPDNTHWEAGPPSIDGDTVRAPLRPLGPAAWYTIEYRIVSADGHPVSGASRFRLTVAGGGTPGGPSAYSGGALIQPQDAANVAVTPAAAASIWPWIVGAGAALILAFTLARRLSSRN
jgi:methionine-rich copper-binding protein CopC